MKSNRCSVLARGAGAYFAGNVWFHCQMLAHTNAGYLTGASLSTLTGGMNYACEITRGVEVKLSI